MIHLLNLLAAIALLVWGIYNVRTGVLRAFGENLRSVLARSVANRLSAMLAGLGVTTLLQSSTATCLIVASFVGSGLIGTTPGLAVMLGADVGTALMVLVFSFDLSWLSPLLIFVGVVFFVAWERGMLGRIGRVLIGLGLITLALQLIVTATRPLTEAQAVRALLAALPDDIGLHLLAGGVLAVLCYSSLAVVLLTATLAAQGLLTLPVAVGLVLGANVGSALLAILVTASGPAELRRLPLGNFIFKAVGAALMIPLLPELRLLLHNHVADIHQQVVFFHLGFNLLMALLFVGFVGPVARITERALPKPSTLGSSDRPRYLDPVALATPSLAISCAAREALSEREGRRWTDIVSFTINMEQIGDCIERILQDLEDKKIRKGRRFSEAGMAEIFHLHERLLANLRLGMSVFLDGHVRDAQRLLEEKARFRDLEREYAANHIMRLQDNTAQSIETSSLHLDLIGELKRINSHICSIAYPILDSAGALASTRLRHSQLASLEERPR